MNIPADMLAEIDEAAEELFSSRSSAVRWLYRHKWSKSTSDCINLHQPESPCITLHTPGEDQDTRAGTDRNECKKNELYTSAKPSLPSDMVKRVTARLNDKAGTSYRPSGAKLRELVQARVNDGATEDDFNTVIDKKCAEWLGTDMQRYLRPLTLFGPKFDQYLGQLSGGPRQSTLIMEPEDEVPPALEDENEL